MELNGKVVVVTGGASGLGLACGPFKGGPCGKVSPKRCRQPWEFARLSRDIVANLVVNGETIRLDGASRLAAK